MVRRKGGEEKGREGVARIWKRRYGEERGGGEERRCGKIRV